MEYPLESFGSDRVYSYRPTRRYPFCRPCSVDTGLFIPVGPLLSLVPMSNLIRVQMYKQYRLTLFLNDFTPFTFLWIYQSKPQTYSLLSIVSGWRTTSYYPNVILSFRLLRLVRKPFIHYLVVKNFNQVSENPQSSGFPVSIKVLLR